MNKDVTVFMIAILAIVIITVTVILTSVQSLA